MSHLFAVTSRFASSSRSFFATEASPDEEDVVLNEISAAIEKAPRAACKLCTAHIERLCRSGNLSAAARLLRSLQDKQLPVFSKAINVLLVAASEKNDIDLVSRVFIDAVASSESLSSACYLNLANAFGRTNDCTRLLGLIEDVSELTFPSTKVLNRIIFAFGESRQVDQALMVFDRIKSLNCKADLITHNIVFDLLGRAGLVDKMLKEFNSMKEASIFPDVVSYNTFLNSLTKVGRVGMCAVYYKEMGDSGIQPDLLTYTAMIEIFGRSGNVEESLRLFSEMKSKQIRPSIYIYRSLVNNLKKMGKLDLATKLLEEMKSCSTSNLARPSDFKPKRR